MDGSRFVATSDELVLPASETLHASDGYPLTYVRYPAVGARRGVVLCLHGIQSHAGWYVASCRRLAEAGYETVFLDRRGSGGNRYGRGDCKNYLQLIDDVHRGVAVLKREHPGLPLILLAISWGGKVAVASIKRQPPLVDGLVLIGPGWFAKVSPSFREKLAIGWSSVFWPRRMINIPLSDPALFTANPRWQQFLRDDPASLRQGTARLLMSSRLLDRYIADAPATITVPTLLMLAGRDRIIDNAKTEKYFERFASQDKDTLVFPEASHTLEFEPEPAPIFERLVGWLDARYGVPASQPR